MQNVIATDTHCGIYFIPSDILTTDDNVYSSDELAILTDYVKNIPTIIRGDLVRLMCHVCERTGLWYRNDGLLIYDGKNVIDLEDNPDDYGTLPRQFDVTKYTSTYWADISGYDGITHNAYVQFDHTSYVNTMIENMKIGKPTDIFPVDCVYTSIPWKDSNMWIVFSSEEIGTTDLDQMMEQSLALLREAGPLYTEYFSEVYDCETEPNLFYINIDNTQVMRSNICDDDNYDDDDYGDDGDDSSDDGANDDGANDYGDDGDDSSDDGANGNDSDDGANDDGANDDGANDDGANDDDGDDSSANDDGGANSSDDSSDGDDNDSDDSSDEEIEYITQLLANAVVKVMAEENTTEVIKYLETLHEQYNIDPPTVDRFKEDGKMVTFFTWRGGIQAAVADDLTWSVHSLDSWCVWDEPGNSNGLIYRMDSPGVAVGETSVPPLEYLKQLFVTAAGLSDV